ncbi:MAG TPA: hypothetical protein VFD04_03955 [Actinomycetes bacterium]|nr:hypothetical protein [Actinomycetes bacterium]
MGLTVDHLVDGSALARWPEPAARHRLEALLLGGRLALCSLTLLELGAAAPGGGHGELLGELGAAYRQVPVGEGASAVPPRCRRCSPAVGGTARSGRRRCWSPSRPSWPAWSCCTPTRRSTGSAR